MATVKKFASAIDKNGGKPFVKVGDKYITFPESGYPETVCIELYSAQGELAGLITLDHLNRLGNACWATPADNWLAKFTDAFSEDEENLA